MQGPGKVHVEPDRILEVARTYPIARTHPRFAHLAHPLLPAKMNGDVQGGKAASTAANVMHVNVLAANDMPNVLPKAQSNRQQGGDQIRGEPLLKHQAHRPAATGLVLQVQPALARGAKLEGAPESNICAEWMTPSSCKILQDPCPQPAQCSWMPFEPVRIAPADAAQLIDSAADDCASKAIPDGRPGRLSSLGKLSGTVALDVPANCT